jgi:gamma-glutamylcyclotransferase (GGCT)/AIG2-like uncharacterized protein YtfP
MITHEVFVYGTLKKGGSNHSLLYDAPIIGSGLTRRPYTLSCVGFPCAALARRDAVGLKDRAGKLSGEVYWADDAVLRGLDRLESNGTMYRRRIRRINMTNGDVRWAWVYEWLGGHRGKIIAPIDGVLRWERRPADKWAYA